MSHQPTENVEGKSRNDGNKKRRSGTDLERWNIDLNLPAPSLEPDQVPQISSNVNDVGEAAFGASNIETATLPSEDRRTRQRARSNYIGEGSGSSSSAIEASVPMAASNIQENTPGTATEQLGDATVRASAPAPAPALAPAPAPVPAPAAAGGAGPRLICPVCMRRMREPTATKCGHVFCKICINDSILWNSKCPVCRVPIRGKTSTFRIYLPLA